MRCFALGTAGTFDIPKLVTYLNDKHKLSHFDNVVHFRLNMQGIPADEGDVFIFPYGAVVLWGLNEALEDEVMALIKANCMERPTDEDDDVYSYDYGQAAKIADDHITLPSKDLIYKLAYSYGLAQSVKLGSFEVTIQKTIELTRTLPEHLAKSGKIPLSRKDIRRMMGRLFIDRNSINLWLEFLDMPEFFWENTELEPIHESLLDYMDHKSRVKVLNQRLEIMHELFDMLGTELNNQHSSRLEWTIIILILIEVIISLGKDIFQVI